MHFACPLARIAESIRKLGGRESLEAIIQQHADDYFITTDGNAALNNINKAGAAIALTQMEEASLTGDIGMIVQSMEAHPKKRFVQANGCAYLWTITRDGK